MQVLRFFILVALFATCTNSTVDAQSRLEQPPDPGRPQLDPVATEMFIGPIEGLTTTWHLAPSRTSIPLGTALLLRCDAPIDTEVEWVGALEVARDESTSTAHCQFFTIGDYEVAVRLIDVSGQIHHDKMMCKVEPIGLNEILVSNIEVAAAPLGISRNSSEIDFVDRHFDPESIARLTDLGTDSFLTSVGRSLRLRAEVSPPGFAPLIEWNHQNSGSSRIGGEHEATLETPALHTISVGPQAQSRSIRIQTYAVRLERSLPAQIIDGETIVLEAATDPPGFENHIRWFASTKWGIASPRFGRGRFFTVAYHNFLSPTGGYWLGFAADHSRGGSDGQAVPCGVGGAACGGMVDCAPVQLPFGLGTASTQVNPPSIRVNSSCFAVLGRVRGAGVSRAADIDCSTLFAFTDTPSIAAISGGIRSEVLIPGDELLCASVCCVGSIKSSVAVTNTAISSYDGRTLRSHSLPDGAGPISAGEVASCSGPNRALALYVHTTAPSIEHFSGGSGRSIAMPAALADRPFTWTSGPTAGAVAFTQNEFVVITGSQITSQGSLSGNYRSARVTGNEIVVSTTGGSTTVTLPLGARIVQFGQCRGAGTAISVNTDGCSGVAGAPAGWRPPGVSCGAGNDTRVPGGPLR